MVKLRTFSEDAQKVPYFLRQNASRAYAFVILSTPAMYGSSTSGTVTLPSSF